MRTGPNPARLDVVRRMAPSAPDVLTTDEVKARLSLTRTAVNKLMSRAVKAGVVVRVRPGCFQRGTR
jgi:predicted transcriptional regulator